MQTSSLSQSLTRRLLFSPIAFHISHEPNVLDRLPVSDLCHYLLSLSHIDILISKAPMDRVPIEIVDSIFSYLKKIDIASARLVCRRFRCVGEDHLFANFEFRLLPRRERWDSLCALANTENIRTRVKTLCFESGVPLEYANYRYWKENVYRDLSFQFPINMRKDEYDKRHRELEAQFPPELGDIYEKYRLLLDEDANYFATLEFASTLSTLLTKLPHLCGIRLMMREPRIILRDLLHNKRRLDEFQPPAVDQRRSAALRRAWCCRHLMSLFAAVNTTRDTIVKFEGVHLPYQFLTMESFLENRKVLQHTEDISISLGAFPYSDWLDRATATMRGNSFNQAFEAFGELSHTLDIAKNLKKLTITMPPAFVTGTFDTFDHLINYASGCYLLLPCLESLNLFDFRCRAARLIDFLDQHKSTLTHLGLSGIELISAEYGSLNASWIFMFKAIQELLDLNSISLRGVLASGVDRRHETWHAHSPDDFSQCTDGAYPAHGLKHKLEGFIIHGGSFPLPEPPVDTGPLDHDFIYTWELMGDASFHYSPRNTSFH